jgi:hypothetical protein
MKAKLNARVYKGTRSGSIDSFYVRELIDSLSFEVRRSGRGPTKALNLPDGITVNVIRRRADRSIIRELIRRGFKVFTQLELFTDVAEVTVTDKGRLIEKISVGPGKDREEPTEEANVPPFMLELPFNVEEAAR